MKLLLIDTETTRIKDPEVIEIASMLYDTDTSANIEMLNTLIPFNKKNEAIEINRISKEMSLQTFNYQAILELIKKSMNECDYCVSYNTQFDRPLVEKLLGIEVKWLCAMRDFKIPHYKKHPSLIELAVHYGIPVFSAHRALDDVVLLSNLFKGLYNFNSLLKEAISRSESKRIKLEAKVSYDDKDLAKDKGFTWNKKSKKWELEINEYDKKNILDDLNFAYSVLS